MSLPYEIGLTYVGLKEVPGAESNEVILGWINEFFPEITDDSQCAWCSIFIIVLFYACCWNTQNVSPVAKSWANLEGAIEVGLFDAQIGDIAISHRKRPEDWEGHVGIILASNDTSIILLSGNHKNQVTVEAWPFNKLF